MNFHRIKTLQKRIEKLEEQQGLFEARLINGANQFLVNIDLVYGPENDTGTGLASVETMQDVKELDAMIESTIADVYGPQA